MPRLLPCCTRTASLACADVTMDRAKYPCVTSKRVAYASADASERDGVCGSKTAPCPTVKAALELAGEGGVVLLPCGSSAFAVSQQISVYGSITIATDGDCTVTVDMRGAKARAFEFQGDPEKTCVHVRGVAIKNADISHMRPYGEGGGMKVDSVNRLILENGARSWRTR